ncbi:hypothetical protein SDC9_206175 [bioreactor metagenome]|uniref:Uncharacterized protein n=1 Tax=bioreactor metagenome TaxID=1076179 RepID=A0A645J5Q0_9ZZZZ
MKELTQQFEKAGFSVKSAYIYDRLKRERVPEVFSEYEQFILTAKRK